MDSRLDWNFLHGGGLFGGCYKNICNLKAKDFVTMADKAQMQLQSH